MKANICYICQNKFVYDSVFEERRDESHFHRNCSQITWHGKHNHIYINNQTYIHIHIFNRLICINVFNLYDFRVVR